jgi:hypothetical protein
LEKEHPRSGKPFASHSKSDERSELRRRRAALRLSHSSPAKNAYHFGGAPLRNKLHSLFRERGGGAHLLISFSADAMPHLLQAFRLQNTPNKKLNPEEKTMEKKVKLRAADLLFCANYVNTGNVRESALKAGYKRNSEQIGLELLSREEINLEIEKQYRQRKRNLLYRACSGYERLAFGSVTDPIKLLYSKESNEISLENLDLFNISEIKKPKDGSIEIKFFDRLKALEKLQELNFSSLEKEENLFYKALERSVALTEEKPSPS